MDFFTNSMLKDWKTCKNKYYFKYIKKILIPQREENFELGKSVHALISYKLNGFDTASLELAASDEVLKHYKSILSHPLLKQQSFLSEWGFNCRIKDTKNIFIGRIDAVFYDDSTGIYTLADWKTGMKIPQIPHDDMQAKIYLYSFYNSQSDLHIDVDFENLKFMFVQTPSLSESSFYFSKELYEKFEAEFIDIIEQIDKYKFESEFESKKTCDYCEYRFLCKKYI